MPIELVTKYTKLFKPSTKQFNLTLDDLAVIHPNISFGPEMPVDFINSLGCYPIEQVIKPTGDVVTELEPILQEDGTYLQTYSAREFNEEELKRNLDNRVREILQSKKNKIQSEITYGYRHSDTDTIQVEQKDIICLKRLVEKANALIDNKSEENIKVRTKENKFIYLKPQDYLELYEKCMDFIDSKKQEYWDLEEELNAAKCIEELKDHY